MRWMNDKDSVSQEELEENRDEAWVDYASADYAVTGDYHAAYYATDTTTTAAAYAAGYWVDKYFDRTGESRNEYLKELEK